MKTTLAESKMTVESVMTRNVQTAQLNDGVRDAARIMVDDGYSALPVVDHKNVCVGMLSRADLTETLFKEDQEFSRFLDSESHLGSPTFWGIVESCGDARVREMMTHEVVTIPVGASVREACQIMAENGIHHLPVVDENRCVEGIVSTFDIIKLLADS